MFTKNEIFISSELRKELRRNKMNNSSDFLRDINLADK